MNTTGENGACARSRRRLPKCRALEQTVVKALEELGVDERSVT
ncbi:MAG: hypothetical protein R2912_11415 [Eubacteriales bacterium]